jgi:ABC-type bacteriocin/lantibiotic exporter with double-glycine peptidase domain
MRNSSNTYRKTWSENFIHHFGMGFNQFLFILLGIGLVLLSIFLLAPINMTLILIGSIIFAVYFLTIILIFNVANTIFTTALYEYADHGKNRSGFSKSLLSGAFKAKAAN